MGATDTSGNPVTDTPAPAADVSVIVIAYNDAARLPTAVRSALAQTLRSTEIVIVDDCSTDGTYEVALELAAAHPGRVRAHRLERNSGGCGAPRNRGMQEARGRYLMFLDSDDELERNACRNMLEAAEETGADLVSGLCVRVHVDSRHHKTVEWYPWLYSETRTLESVAELPDLFVYDTLSTNKCYRRDFLLQQNLLFPVGIHYEDLLFSASAYLAATRIALIPNHVYFWNVAENAAADGARSISNRRHEIANFAQRMEIHRRIDELLERRRLPELKFHKDVKFLKHDLVLHLRDLPLLDEEYRRRFAELVGGYLESIGPEAYAEAQPIQAICAYLLAREDWDNLLPAADTLTNRDKISSPLAERDGRIYWCTEHLDDPEGRRVLDVTDLGHHTAELRTLFLRNRLTDYADDGRGTIRLSGEIVNPLGRIRPDATVRGQLEFRARRRSVQTFRFPLNALRHAGDHLAWTAEADLGRRLRPLGVIDAVWDVRLLLDVDGERLRTRLSADGLALERARPLHVRPRLTRLVADRLEPRISRRGHLSFVLVARGRAAERTRRAVDAAVHSRAGDLAKSGFRTARRAKRRLDSGDTKIRAYHAVLCRLPIRKGLVVFESHLGKQYSDSPRAIYEEMRRQDVVFEPVWSYAGRTPRGFPDSAVLVRRWSWPYLRALAQAEFWIDNQGLPLKLTKRPGTTYIQTWHGSALKRMGFDEPGKKLLSRTEQEEYQRVLDRFDHFLVRSEHDVRTLVRALRLREEVLLRTGYPRNDALVAARRQAEETGTRERGPLAAELGIPDDRQVLLYAPTFRSSASGRGRRFELPFDVEEFAHRFGDRFVLLVRAHYLDHVVLPPSVRGAVLDVSGRHDATPLLALTDALITDYSSVMFDYALLDRPMIFYAYDWEEYAGEARGTYFDLREKAPGPVVETEDALFAAVADLKRADTEYADARRRFAEEFGEYDRGDAARTVVRTFFTTGGGA
ncbi:bifunctional glycosyltransferase family 2 protein/CDP-glycerol:glycerophosphate glycerophosphotransferase [Streptomyces sp. NPDC051776]|uniref:bifunctional glycosyltransferase/CDP-glycerol:glycerophosphate glycerophosphotransferase n=1 Tax=Streptomyces sp. NPDC051776 TaxID=3155414 RepID=UPI003431B2F0